MKRQILVALLFAAVGGVSGCDMEKAMSERGFRLPEGNAMAGRDTFLNMHCNQCHTIEGAELPDIEGFEPFVRLGGPVSRVKTYGELVTSIINPSHEIAKGYPKELVADERGRSKMYDYNDFMTVRELTDLVTYLQPFYDVVPPEFEFRVYP